MEFEYTSSIYISSEDLREMYLRVKRGEDFEEVFMDIMAGYEDEDYYHASDIIEQVKEEINRRLEQSKQKN